MKKFMDKTGKELMITSLISFIMAIVSLILLIIYFDWSVFILFNVAWYAGRFTKEYDIFLEIAEFKKNGGENN
jgi:hypothetical protein